MRILIVVGVLRQREAGAAGVVFNHAAELEKLGHQVDCWFFDDILQTPRWPSRFKDLEFAFKVSSRIRRQPGQFDVVNLHAPCGCIYGLARKWSASAKLPPYVFTMQGSEERYTHAMRFEQQLGRAANFSWKNRAWHRAYHQRMYDLSISTANYGAVANREGWILSELKYDQPSGHIWYVPNGVNESFFQPRAFPDAPANKLLYVGTWIDRKGIYYLSEAFAALARRLPQVQLTVAGCLVGEEQVKASFPEAVRRQVSVIPFLSREAMPELYAAHDIFVFPSLVEGMPLTLLEAMAGAMPAVTTNTCGMADLVQDEVNGLLVAPADSESLHKAMARLSESADLRRRLGTAAQETARHYTWPIVTAQLERVLRIAVESTR